MNKLILISTLFLCLASSANSQITKIEVFHVPMVLQTRFTLLKEEIKTSPASISKTVNDSVSIANFDTILGDSVVMSDDSREPRILVEVHYKDGKKKELILQKNGTMYYKNRFSFYSKELVDWLVLNIPSLKRMKTND